MARREGIYSSIGGGGLPGERDGDAHWKIRIRPKGDQSGHGSGFI